MRKPLHLPSLGTQGVLLAMPPSEEVIFAHWQSWRSKLRPEQAKSWVSLYRSVRYLLGIKLR